MTKEVAEAMAIRTPHRLLSCHGAYIKAGHNWLADVLKNPNAKTENTILLDSGAFTAWNQGHVMELKDLMPVYYDFMSKYWSSVKDIWLINLDKIPGSPGRTADQAEIDDCIRISDENYNILVREFGPRVLPVYHQGESKNRLLDIAKMGDYICISPRNDLHESFRVAWSREAHAAVPAGKKTHGLAATGIVMMTTVPWGSVDSAAWIFKSGTGVISIVLHGNLIDLGVSPKSPTRFDPNRHIMNVDPVTRKQAVARIESLGFTVEQLAESHSARTDIIMQEVHYWVANHHRCDFSKPPSLFDL